MEIVIKLGDARLPTHLAYEKNWLDGQPIEARWDGFKWGSQDRKNFLIIRTLDDFWQVRGGTDWKVWNRQAQEFKKIFSPKNSLGYYKWEFGYLIEEKRIRMRDRFLDITAMLKAGTISRNYYDNLYNHDIEAGILNLNISLFDILKYEGLDSREVIIKNQGITSGTYSIGSGLNYAIVTTFAADVVAGGQMDGDLTGEHNDEETAIATDVLFDTDTNTHLLKLTAQSGDEHNGTFGNATHEAGDGARINFTDADSLNIDETIAGDLDDLEISKLVLDIRGANDGIRFTDGGDSGQMHANRLVILGDSNSVDGIYIKNEINNVLVTNNIIYNVGDGAGDAGITCNRVGSTEQVVEIYNNTVIGCYENIIQDDDTPAATAFVVKNNLCQAAGIADFRDDGSTFGTTGHNVSEDATGPDAAYDETDVHTNSVFKDYANDDFRLDSGGDSTNLAIVDDGEDLSGTFTDDIEGQTRSTWYIGASEVVAAAGGIEILRRRIEGY